MRRALAGLALGGLLVACGAGGPPADFNTYACRAINELTAITSGMDPEAIRLRAEEAISWVGRAPAWEAGQELVRRIEDAATNILRDDWEGATFDMQAIAREVERVGASGFSCAGT